MLVQSVSTGDRYVSTKARNENNKKFQVIKKGPILREREVFSLRDKLKLDSKSWEHNEDIISFSSSKPMLN